MKKFIFLIIFSIWTYSCGIAETNNTTIYIVRHAEKDLSNPNNQDPDLSDEGYIRAKNLAEKLKGEKFDAVFATKYKRTAQTAALIAENNKLAIQTYDGHAFKEISDLIQSKYANQKILIVGHSNTVLELIESFGIARPLTALRDGDYDFLFEIKINHMGKALLNTSQYGKSHRETIIELRH
jgi:2,3-bisphosphoglycerate-dependent phosphoglycerate mutase